MALLDIFKKNPAQSPAWDLAQAMQAGEYSEEVNQLREQATARGLDPDLVLLQLISKQGRQEQAGGTELPMPGNPELLSLLAPGARAAELRGAGRASERVGERERMKGQRLGYF